MDKRFFRVGGIWVLTAVILAGAMIAGAAPALRAETTPGGVMGIIKAERSFARLYGVRVVAVNRETGQSWETVSNNYGFYGMAVDPGIYDLSFHHKDYLTHIEGPVAVRDNSSPSVDVVLWDLDEPGSSALIGHIFWPNQWPAAHFTVKLRNNAGQLLDQVLTDDLGSFSFELGRANQDLTLEFYNQDGNYDGNISFQTTDRTARVLSTVDGGFRNYYEDRGPWY